MATADGCELAKTAISSSPEHFRRSGPKLKLLRHVGTAKHFRLFCRLWKLLKLYCERRKRADRHRSDNLVMPNDTLLGVDSPLDQLAIGKTPRIRRSDGAKLAVSWHQQ